MYAEVKYYFYFRLIKHNVSISTILQENNFMTIRHFLIFFIFLPSIIFGQNNSNISAHQIIDSSLAFAGGEHRISKLESCKITYSFKQSDYATAIISEHVLTGEKYVQSILSKTLVPQTTFFNGDRISQVNGSLVLHNTDLITNEEIRLKTFSHIQYGYKKLGYQLARLPDHKFKYFDCFVVNAISQNGYTTMNFFDKTNFRLIMVVYPNGNKSLMMDYVFKDSILFNSQIVNTISKSEET